jgi:hypothetical protein
MSDAFEGRPDGARWRPVWTALVLALVPAIALFGQSRTVQQGPHRMEISLERLEGTNWRIIDPSLVLAQGDRVRFRFRTNFDGYLYVTNQNSSGKYEQLFPRAETGHDNHIVGSRDYQVPSTSSAFRISGPAGYETVYWLVAPARLTEPPPRFDPVPPRFESKPLTLTPRCDDAILKSRGDCIDHAAGPRLVPRGEDLPQTLAEAAVQGPRDLLFMRQQDTNVISSPVPLSGPVIYEFKLAHK